MKMSLVVDGLRSDVVAVGELGDETVAAVADRIADVLGRSVPGRILDLLSDAAAELTATLPDGHVDIRVAGDDVDMTLCRGRTGSGCRADGGGRRAVGSHHPAPRRRRSSPVSKRARRADGVSVNTFIVRALERGTSSNRNRSGRVGNRLHGYGTT